MDYRNTLELRRWVDENDVKKRTFEGFKYCFNNYLSEEPEEFERYFGKYEDEKLKVFFYNETGTYFTNEITDGMPWEALIGTGDSICAFDIAIAPSHLLYFYFDAPSEFIKQTIQDKHMYIRNEV